MGNEEVKGNLLTKCGLMLSSYLLLLLVVVVTVIVMNGGDCITRS